MTSTLGDDLTHDAFLGGRLRLWQPRTGYRAGVDPVLLAASVPAKPGQSVLDLGCGVGTAALCLGARVPDLDLVGVERQPKYARLANQNGLQTYTDDISDLPDTLKARSFDHVLANPPFFDRNSGAEASDAGREAGRGAQTPVAAWIDAAARRLKHKGYLHMIHRAEQVPQLLAGAAGRLGSLELWPLCPRVGKPAELVIFRARKNGRTDFRLHFPIILHSGHRHEQDGDSYTPEIKGVLRYAESLRI